MEIEKGLLMAPNNSYEKDWAEAKLLGIKNPEALKDEDLSLALGYCQALKKYKEKLSKLDVKLPPHIESMGVSNPIAARRTLEQAQQFLWKTLASRLKRVKDNSPVVYKGNHYTVSTVTKEPQYRNYVEWYFLLPAEGGKPIKVN